MNVINIEALTLVRMSKINLIRHLHQKCNMLVIGGGTGGCSIAAKSSKYLHPNEIVIVEPSEIHYYQPLFTLVGGGLKSFQSSYKPMAEVLPKGVKWIKDSVISFKPDMNTVVTSNGDIIEYKIMIVAMGLQLYWDKIPGLVDALKNPDAQVSSIYGPETVANVFNNIKKTQDGVGLFTFPNTAVKCPGAPQKIAYLAEDFWRQNNLRSKIDVVYNTSLPVIFGVKKYADALWKVCESRNIKVNLHTCMIEVKGDSKEAVFQNMKNPSEKFIQKYSFLHVCPPMGPPDVLKKHPRLTNEYGYLNVDSKTLQHNEYKNIFGLGDCTNTPNSKTMAAIASQSQIIYYNVQDYISNRSLVMFYDGYASCPLVTAPGKCILAEFDYNLQPLETFPVDQKNELWIMYIMKKYFFPYLYWNYMLKGNWNGPATIRKYLRIFKFNK